MEERHFDAWTRTLGAATSRRQVLKGVLGGVLALVAGRAVEPMVAEAAPVYGCFDGPHCRQQAKEAYAQCFEGCVQEDASCTGGGGRYGGIVCLLGWWSCTRNCSSTLQSDRDACRHSGCLTGTDCCDGECVNTASGDPFNCGACGHVCPRGAQCVNSECLCDRGQDLCNDICVDLDTDPNNCGTCGHACDPGVACDDGQCQCDIDQTLCGNHCVDTQSDNNNCGSCGNVCGDCEQCEAGTCQPLTCDSDRTCCQHACYPKCEHNQMNPQTCQCGFCDSLEDGTTCGPTSICCQHDCVDTTCPDGKEFNDSTCQCECTPVTCPDGQTQDPETCQCRDKCVDVTCDTCHTCDPDSGSCVKVQDNMPCGSNLVCCDGVCTEQCTCSETQLQCLSGECCDHPSLPGAGLGYSPCVAPGPADTGGGITIGGCCPSDKLMKYSGKDDNGVCRCDAPNYGVFCEGNLPDDPNGCTCGYWLT